MSDIEDYDEVPDPTEIELLAEVAANQQILDAKITAICELLIARKVFTEAEFMERFFAVQQREQEREPGA